MEVAGPLGTPLGLAPRRHLIPPRKTLRDFKVASFCWDALKFSWGRCSSGRVLCIEQKERKKEGGLSRSADV